MPSSTSIPIIVQGNSFSLAIPLQIYVISEGSMVLQDYTPDPTDQVSIQLKGSRRQYTYAPTITGNTAFIDLSGNEMADNYGVVVSIVKADGTRLRSFRTDQFFIVESSDDLTSDDIIEGLENNVIYLNSQAFVAGEDGRGIDSIEKTGTSGLVDTYTIYYSDNTTSTFDVTNGAPGQDGVGITSIAKTATVGLVDTYTITLSNGETTTFDVTNGKDGVELGLATIVDNLTTDDPTEVLSARQGKVLKDMIDSETLSGSISKTYKALQLAGRAGYCSSSGQVVIDGAYQYILLDISSVTKIDATGSFNNRIIYFASDGTTRLGMTSSAIVQSSSFPNGAVYAAISYAKNNINANITIDYKISEPIAEVDNDKFYMRTLTYPTCDSVVDSTTGEQSYSAGWKSIYGLIPLYGADVISCLDGEPTRQCFAFFDKSLTLISTSAAFLSAKVPNGAVYARIRLGTVLTLTQANVNYFYGSEEGVFKYLDDMDVRLKKLSPMPLYGKTVAFLGDSITSTSSYGQFVALFAQRTGANIENFGANGQTYANGQIAAEAANLTGSEKLVIIMAGTNDFGHNCPIGNTHDVSNGTIIPTTDTTTMCGGIHQAISAIYAKCPTVKIVIITPPQGESAWTANTQGKYLYEYVDAIKDVAKLYGIPVIDQFSNCNVPAFLAPMKAAYFFNDGIHPNYTYHVLLAEWLYNGLANWIKEPFC